MPATDSRRMRTAIGRLQRLCCLGLDEQLVMPLLTELAEELVPSSTTGIILSTQDYEVRNAYFEGSILDVLPKYFSEYYGARVREVSISFGDSFRGCTQLNKGYEWVTKVEFQQFLASDYYNEIIIPGKVEQPLYLNFFNGRRPGGLLMISREAGRADFTPAEQGILRACSQFIAHALHGGANAGAYVETADRAVAILDRDGHILASSAETRRLLMMALSSEWPESVLGQDKLEDLPDVAACCRRLARALDGEVAGAPPVIRRRNPWGAFVLRAYPIDGSDGKGSIGLTIERWEPRVAALLRVIEQLPLTEREKDLCLALAQGRDAAGTATAMGISENTAITHRRNLYRKLGVGSRSALIDRLQFDMAIDVGEAQRSAARPTCH